MVSVVLTTLNGEQKIRTQLDSLVGQRPSVEWELIVADNGSSDATLEIVWEYEPKLPSLRIVDASDKAGYPHAANAGVGAADGDRILFVNDDDEAGEGWIDAMSRALEQSELAAGRLEYRKLNEPWLVAVRGEAQSEGLPRWSLGTHLAFGFGCALGVRREVHDAIGGFDEQMVPAAEDADYCWRAQYAGAEIRFVPDAVMHYRLRSDFAGIYRQGRNYGIGDVLLYKKHRRHGLPAVDGRLGGAARAWAGIAKRSLTVSGNERRGVFLWLLGWRVGRFRGSVRQRVLLP